MTTIPSRLAQVARVSANHAEARSRALTLYRDWYRAAPEICSLYALDVPPSAIRGKVREMFEKNRDVDDLRVIDRLIFKGRQEYQETLNAWKQIPHIMNMFAKEDAPPKPQTFLEKFYAGRDEGR